MAVVKLNTPPPGAFRWLLRQELDGKFYRLLFRWNMRAGAWFVDVAGDDGRAQVRGVKMCLGTDKLRAHKYREVPPGDLRVVDSTGTGNEPTWADFGSRVMVEYVEDDTVEVLPPPEPYTDPS